MKIFITPLKQAICSAVELLTRTKVSTGGPFHLLKPAGEPLLVDLVALNPSCQPEAANILVRCETWTSPTKLVLKLRSSHGDDWIPWGQFYIEYGPSYPVASLAGRKIDQKEIFPRHVSNPDAMRQRELCIRSRIRSRTRSDR